MLVFPHYLIFAFHEHLDVAKFLLTERKYIGENVGNLSSSFSKNFLYNSGTLPKNVNEKHPFPPKYMFHRRKLVIFAYLFSRVFQCGKIRIRDDVHAKVFNTHLLKSDSGIRIRIQCAL